MAQASARPSRIAAMFGPLRLCIQNRDGIDINEAEVRVRTFCSGDNALQAIDAEYEIVRSRATS